jgi:hypothetical protein
LHFGHIFRPDALVLLDLQSQVESRLRELMTLVEISDNAVKCERQQQANGNGGNLEEKVSPVVRNRMNGVNVGRSAIITGL